jgi:hypothetical protein
MNKGGATQPADSRKMGGAFKPRRANMKRINWDRALESMVLVRLGQDLGHDTPIARFVHDAIDMILTAATSFF